MPETQLSPERQPSSERLVPEMSTIGPVVDDVIDIAREQLKRPIKVRLRTWEDREFEVHVKHWYPAGSGTRYGYEAIVRYHSDEEVIKGFLTEKDTIDDEREVLLETELGHIPDPVRRKNEG
jgi:hypothetical protein